MKNGSSLTNLDKNQKLSLILIVVVVLLIILALFVCFNDPKTDGHTNATDTIFTTQSGKKIKTVYKDLGKFLIRVPSDFKPMSKELLELKYPLGNTPKKAYANEDASISIVYNGNNTELSGMNLTEFVETSKSTFSQMGYFYYYFPLEVNGLDVHTIALNTNAIDSKIYNYMIIFSVDDEIMILNFNCTENHQSEWSQLGEFIAKSIKVK
ncbi:MAG: hypothetical protein IJO63_01550 [Bacilli bacterium]|nr:hypothetical protein [Bacilli bacterium]